VALALVAEAKIVALVAEAKGTTQAKIAETKIVALALCAEMKSMT
jgi:hypothetical protein